MSHNVKQPETVSHILVFKTSIQTPVEVQFLSYIFDSEDGISGWSIDFDDWEKILRIESTGISPDDVESILQRINIRCKQL